MPYLTKKSIIISAAILLVVTAALVWVISNPDGRPSDRTIGPSEQSDTQNSQPNETISDEEFETQQNQPPEEDVDFPEEVPPQEVDDRGGYTPY